MKRVSYVFATGETWLDRLVTVATRSEWSHVAFWFEEADLLVESQAGRGFLLERGIKYADWRKSKQISFSVSDDSYAALLAQSHQWQRSAIGYGYATCLAIGIKELLGGWAGRALLAMLPRSAAETLVCSELLVKLWRQVEPGFFAGQDCRLVSPEELYRVLLQRDERDKIDKPADCAYNC